VCQIGAIVGIVLWQLFDSPAIGVVASIIIDFIGALPTIRHSWKQPGEETWSSYALSGIGGILAVFALETYNWVSLPYAVYIVLINMVLAYILITRGKTVASETVKS
jgi:hypothetical protein